MPVAEDELLLLTRRWLTVVVDVVEERLLKPVPLMYPPPNGTDVGVATVLVPIVVVDAADDLLTLRSVGPAVSVKSIENIYIIKSSGMNMKYYFIVLLI